MQTCVQQIRRQDGMRMCDETREGNPGVGIGGGPKANQRATYLNKQTEPPKAVDSLVLVSNDVAGRHLHALLKGRQVARVGDQHRAKEQHKLEGRHVLQRQARTLQRNHH